jgi:3-methyladenine DNA glycosylase Mpg
MDPRLDVSEEELASLLAFQQQVTGVLQRAVTLHDEIEAASEEEQAASMADIPDKVAKALTALAIDLEHADAAPTASQRELFEYESRRFDQANKEWVGLR